MKLIYLASALFIAMMAIIYMLLGEPLITSIWVLGLIIQVSRWAELELTEDKGQQK